MSPVKVLMLKVSLLAPSSILKSTLAPPLNTKLPPFFVSKFNGTSMSVPSVAIVFVVSNVIFAAAAPTVNLGVVVSTLKKGSVAYGLIVLSIDNPLMNNPEESTLPICVAATEMPMTSFVSLKRPVVVEFSKLRDGVVAAPSAILAVKLAMLDPVPPLTVTPPVNVAVPLAARVPFMVASAAVSAPPKVPAVKDAAPVVLIFQVPALTSPLGFKDN